MIIKEIEASDAYNIRNLILRPGKPVAACEFNGDAEEQNFHLGAFVDGQLISIASFFLENNNEFSEEVQYRIRGMATIEKFRSQGFSANLIKTGIPVIKKNQAKLVWCNARLSAQGFYQKIGFKTCSEVFDIPDIGPHVLMKLELK